MSSVLRNPGDHFVTREAEHDDEYYVGDEAEAGRDRDHGWRIFSTRQRRSTQYFMTSSSYRRERARKRQIFLRTYKLSSISTRGKLMRSRKLKKLVVKVKMAAAAVLAFMRGGALRSCSSRPTIRASSPTRVYSFC